MSLKYEPASEQLHILERGLNHLTPLSVLKTLKLFQPTCVARLCPVVPGLFGGAGFSVDGVEPGAVTGLGVQGL